MNPLNNTALPLSPLEYRTMSFIMCVVPLSPFVYCYFDNPESPVSTLFSSCVICVSRSYNDFSRLLCRSVYTDDVENLSKDFLQLNDLVDFF